MAAPRGGRVASARAEGSLIPHAWGPLVPLWADASPFPVQAWARKFRMAAGGVPERGIGLVMSWCSWARGSGRSACRGGTMHLFTRHYEVQTWAGVGSIGIWARFFGSSAGKVWSLLERNEP